MTYRELYEKAERKLEKGEITSGEFDEMTKPLDEEIRPKGEWVDVPKYKGYYVCSNCLERLDGDFERFDHWEMKKENFCSVCGSDNRKAVQSEKDSDRNRG